MNQKVMNWRNDKGMPEIEKIIADSYGERYVGKCNNTTFVIKCGTIKRKDGDVPFYAQISIRMKDTGGYGKNGINYHKPSNFRDDYPYNGKAHVEEWETYLNKKQTEKKSKVKAIIDSLPTDMKQKLLTALLSELKGE